MVLLCTYKMNSGDSGLFSSFLCSPLSPILFLVLICQFEGPAISGNDFYSTSQAALLLISLHNPHWTHSHVCSQHFSCIYDPRSLVCPFSSCRSASSYLVFEAHSYHSGYWQTLIILLVWGLYCPLLPTRAKCLYSKEVAYTVVKILAPRVRQT